MKRLAMTRLALVLLISGLTVAAASTAQAEGRRMIVFALYGAAGTSGSTATTTVIDFTTQVACREARDELPMPKRRASASSPRAWSRSETTTAPALADAVAEIRNEAPSGYAALA